MIFGLLPVFFICFQQITAASLFYGGRQNGNDLLNNNQLAVNQNYGDGILTNALGINARQNAVRQDFNPSVAVPNYYGGWQNGDSSLVNTQLANNVNYDSGILDNNQFINADQNVNRQNWWSDPAPLSFDGTQNGATWQRNDQQALNWNYDGVLDNNQNINTLQNVNRQNYQSGASPLSLVGGRQNGDTLLDNTQQAINENLGGYLSNNQNINARQIDNRENWNDYYWY